MFFQGYRSLAAAWLALLAVLVVSLPRPAQADVSSWVFVGAGPSIIERVDSELQPMLQIDAGMGSPATSPIVVGGVFNLQTHFGRGTDLGVSLRTTTRGFTLGDWGAGVDLGLYQRWWEQNSTGAIGKLVLGAPWGITGSLGASFGTNDHRAYTAALGLDFARLTVYRKSGLEWFPNPHPATGAE